MSKRDKSKKDEKDKDKKKDKSKERERLRLQLASPRGDRPTRSTASSSTISALVSPRATAPTRSSTGHGISSPRSPTSREGRRGDSGDRKSPREKEKKEPLSPRGRSESEKKDPRTADKPAMVKGEGTQLPQYQDAVMPSQDITKPLLPDDTDEIQIFDAEGRLCTLHIAAALDRRKDIELILKTGAFLFSLTKPECAYPSKKGSIDVNKPDSVGATALHHASYRGHQKTVKLLLQKGAPTHSVVFLKIQKK